MNMFMWQNMEGSSERNTVSFQVENLKVLFTFVLINAKVKVLLGYNLIIYSSLKLSLFFFFNLFFKSLIFQFLVQKTSNLLFNSLYVGMVVSLLLSKLGEESLLCTDVI